jgi:hypothetical protein
MATAQAPTGRKQPKRAAKAFALEASKAIH